MASSDASAFGRKGVAYRVTFPILDADGDLVTGATGLDSEVSKDGGTFADCTNEATEIATSSGVYYLDLTATEMNADTVAVIVKTSSSGAKTTTLVIYPLKDGDIIANMTQVGGQTASASGTVTFPAATLASTTNITAGTIATVTNRVTANTDQLAGQTVTAAAGVTFPASIASPTNITSASGVTLASSQTFSTTGSVGSVTGAVGSVAGNVGGNVVGSVGSVTDPVTVGTNNDKTGYSLATAPPTAGAIADAVWDEAYNQHTTAGTFGKLMDILRKANYVTEGSVAAGGTPTTTVFRTDLTEATGTFDNQTLLFVSGALTGQSAPIETYSVTNGTITVGDPLTAAPTAGDAFVILPDHVHPLGEIADAVLDDAVEGSETLQQTVRLMRAALVGKLSGAANTTVTFRDAADTKARITATVDADGNRSAVTTDAT